MRVVGGRLRSRRIKRVPGAGVRPTKDRVREAIFNMIGPELPPVSVLDLFSGCGAFAIEAVSRGADKALAVEIAPKAVSTIKDNVSGLGLEEKITVLRGDVMIELGTLSSEKRAFDMIFADPPYDTGLARKTLNMIARYDILVHSGILIIEHSPEEELEKDPKGLSLLKQKTYGKTSVSFFRQDE